MVCIYVHNIIIITMMMIIFIAEFITSISNVCISSSSWNLYDIRTHAVFIFEGPQNIIANACHMKIRHTVSRKVVMF